MTNVSALTYIISFGHLSTLVRWVWWADNVRCLRFREVNVTSPQSHSLEDRCRLLFGSAYSKADDAFFKKDFIYLFLEMGREGESEGEKHQCVVASQAPSTGDQAHNPGLCPDWESKWHPFGSQAVAQSTEPHQPGQMMLFESPPHLYV